MIQANELRIGNYIADRGNKVWQINHWESCNKVGSKGAEIVIDGKSYGFGHPLTEEIDYLQPIPLTPELLEKAGFTKSVFNQNKYYKDMGSLPNNNVLWINLENKDAKIRSESAGMLEFIYPKHLHQLQNLFWCLTGEELTINL